MSAILGQEGMADDSKVVVKEAHLRQRRAARWSVIVGGAAVLLQGSRLIREGDFASATWNDVSLLGAFLAVVYGFLLARGGPSRDLGIAGGTLGLIVVVKVFVWPDVHSALAELTSWLPDMVSADGVLMTIFLLFSIWYVVIRGDVKTKTKSQK